jgi:hypothetical protein
MSEEPRRKGDRLGGRSALEADIDRTLAELLSGTETSEAVRTAKKIIKTPDSETTVTYELQVNPRTGKQEVIENVITSKKECSTCGTYVSRLYRCSFCGKEVCGRHYGSVDVVTAYYESPHPLTDKRGVCSNCYFDKTGHRWDQS